jgi:hypothetical protein
MNNWEISKKNKISIIKRKPKKLKLLINALQSKINKLVN